MADKNRARHGKVQVTVLLERNEAELADAVCQLEHINRSILIRRALLTYCVRSMDQAKKTYDRLQGVATSPAIAGEDLEEGSGPDRPQAAPGTAGNGPSRARSPRRPR